MSTVNRQVLQAIEALPENTTFEQGMERIYFLAKVERGIPLAREYDGPIRHAPTSRSESE